jgi:FtsH ternary system domain X5
MSRAYRIRVSESLNRTIRAEDSVRTQLELLEVLPPEQMAALLREELKGRGFEECEGKLFREDGDLTTTVDPESGTVTVESKAVEDVELQGQREGLAYDDFGPGEKSVRRAMAKQLQDDLAKQAEHEQTKVQAEATKRLEGHLVDLRKELNGAVNRVTAEALKRKAAQIGQIKEVTEDPQSGSLTIKVEV